MKIPPSVVRGVIVFVVVVVLVLLVLVLVLIRLVLDLVIVLPPRPHHLKYNLGRLLRGIHECSYTSLAVQSCYPKLNAHL